jgi:hypothetical protein
MKRFGRKKWWTAIIFKQMSKGGDIALKRDNTTK